MATPCPRTDNLLDLSAPPCLSAAAERLQKSQAPAAFRRVLTELTEDENPRIRMQALCDVYRKLETNEIAGHLKAAARLALRHEPAGLRLLFSFLEVKRPGVEVMRQVESLSSVERVALRILNGTWTEPTEGDVESAGEMLKGTIRRASRMGAVGRQGAVGAGSADIVSGVIRPLRDWFRHAGSVLDSGRKLPPAIMELVTDIARLEIAMLERRLSHIAGRVDPYDGRAISRLMPILSFYDQDIEHLRMVVSQLETYRPFRERLLTMERALSRSEIDAITKALSADPEGEPASRIITVMRNGPLLDREFAYLVAAAHQVAVLRAAELQVPPPDMLSLIHEVIVHSGGENGLEITMERAVMEAIRPAVENLGLVEGSPRGFAVPFRDENSTDWILPDGLPRLTAPQEETKKDRRTIRDLVQAQIGNEPFLLGILDNTRVTSYPGVVPLIVMQSRSIRVLSKIATTRRLQTGPSNKDVPRLLLLTPVRIPVNTLKQLIHVRFISRVDLERLARSGTEIRPEIRKEIEGYIALLKK